MAPRQESTSPRQKSEARHALETMEVGDDFLVIKWRAGNRAHLNAAAKLCFQIREATGKTFRARSDAGHIRIWRMS